MVNYYFITERNYEEKDKKAYYTTLYDFLGIRVSFLVL